ncbi:uncharacterized protein B0H18DRAFT_382533 [Fomitopsis serialis]|uniref:uncharacterized protein n=1 Tax=Fomitopsis serialis TaxID=139415 RepID=UPI0020083DB7|nr:uncharacterized protein B0H18DRAFT_382533 [Neoantrodia serialis]KAH9925271.1 hypothetical protein B0H18DRAFT_382533 [Neoantrodia serialis]
MLVDAPNEYGQRYIATAVHVAATGEADLVLRLACVFLDDLLLPMLANMSAVNRLPPSSSPTPILQVEPAAIEIEPVDRTEQQELDRLRHIRENRTCCVTGFSSDERALELHASGQLAQVRAIVELETAYVIPLALNSFDEPHSASGGSHTGYAPQLDQYRFTGTRWKYYQHASQRYAYQSIRPPKIRKVQDLV